MMSSKAVSQSAAGEGITCIASQVGGGGGGGGRGGGGGEWHPMVIEATVLLDNLNPRLGHKKLALPFLYLFCIKKHPKEERKKGKEEKDLIFISIHNVLQHTKQKQNKHESTPEMKSKHCNC